jgi:hypothetical protein
MTAKEAAMEMCEAMRKRLQDQVSQWVDAELQVDIIMNLADIYAEATRSVPSRCELAGETGERRALVTSAGVAFV